MASSEFLKSLKKGQILRASVEEVSSATEVLCSFHGDLLLIQNRTGIKLRKGDPIFLQLISVHPLQFQIFDSNNNSRFQRVV